MWCGHLALEDMESRNHRLDLGHLLLNFDHHQLDLDLVDHSHVDLDHNWLDLDHYWVDLEHCWVDLDHYWLDLDFHLVTVDPGWEKVEYWILFGLFMLTNNITFIHNVHIYMHNT